MVPSESYNEAGYNSLARLRLLVLPNLLGRRVSQYALALSLGISAKQVARLELLPESRLPPSIRLACEYIEANGLQHSDQLLDPVPADIYRIAGGILLPKERIATLLGKHRQVLYSLEHGRDQKTVKRFLMLALVRIRELYGLTDPELKDLEQRLEVGLRYRDRRKGKPGMEHTSGGSE